ncbi:MULTISPECIES: DNA methyltransferase [unclassified Coleofasciculus]|uniref:DNA methyltransferase n=1 Tax=unclassified Coleofasciculus TaxID=2692782 RepID=UPI00187E2F40|nr:MULTISPECIES: DNA methyltransferase [unclassified Coleofasciculus]MBE9126073.1 type I restriction enzyme HsdR N-terminal domain-containing protein [Coleofasciculus sp. LEGE 07081]MBE9149486.1 type I restriction enzyme HsdR N-terminal domain-containing protein [Coleofasciculus sp. LEGE 07092]
MTSEPQILANLKALQSLSLGSTEQDVREDFIKPLLESLGYRSGIENAIERNVSLKVSYVKIGTKKINISTYPDYVLSVAQTRKWVLDAKNPDESVLDVEHIFQVHSYAMHKEINVRLYALCNGNELALYRTIDNTNEPVFYIRREELVERWDELYQLLSVEAFQNRLHYHVTPKIPPLKEKSSNLSESHPKNIIDQEPLRKIIIPRKQASQVHARTHPYFTRRPWNVIQEYIRYYSNRGDVILDPYGGSGVTVIEALVLGRKGIYFDINPIATFMTRVLALAPVDLAALNQAFNSIAQKCQTKINEAYSQDDFNHTIDYWYPTNVSMPPDADVDFLDELFSQRQLFCLSLLLHEIEKIKNPDIRDILKLVFSATLVKCNISYHNTGRDEREGGGDSGFTKYYRYFVPKQRYPEVNVWAVFEKKYGSIYKAKSEINTTIGNRYQDLQIFQASATEMLNYIEPNSVDYIYTDPPYGAKISYLDLSTIWNAWLKLPLPSQTFEQEAIEGGSRKKTLKDYDKLLAESLQKMAQVLKPDRWISIVFVSEKPAHWHTIYDTCTQLGLEYVNTVRQPSDRKTPRKIKNPLRHFCGEMVINFRKRSHPVIQVKSKLDRDIIDIIKQTAELTIINNNGAATTEEINDAMITELLSNGYLQEVTEKVSDFGELLREYFDYDTDANVWKIKAKTKLGSHIPLDKRIQFYLQSTFNKAKRLNQRLTIDDIVPEVMPYLRNGKTPDSQDILSELEKMAYPDGEYWEVNTGTQLTLKLD